MKMNGLGISLEDVDKYKISTGLHLLDDRERHIILHLTGANNTPTKSLNAISDELQISRERTRQIAIIAIGKLDAASQKDKDEVIESMLYLIDNVYDGELPKSFDIKSNHTKLYWKIRGTHGGYTAIVEEIKELRHML